MKAKKAQAAAEGKDAEEPSSGSADLLGNDEDNDVIF